MAQTRTQQPNDIVPALYAGILKDFKNKVAHDAWVKGFDKRLKNGKATQDDAAKYADILGHAASQALSTGLRPENLPDGKIYWNIAKRTVEPLLQEVTDMVNDAMVIIIEAEHKKKRIGIKPKRAPFNQDRCDAIMNKIVNLSLGETDGE